MIDWGIKNIKEKKDNKLIYDFLDNSSNTSKYQYRSTKAIASKINLTKLWVEELCAKHKKISRNTNKKQTWRISNSSFGVHFP